MTTLSNTPRTTLKTRDKIKYAFATVLAVLTVVAIGGLMLARYERHKTSVQEEMQMQRAITIYGEDGGLPEKIELPDAPVAPAAGGLPKQ